MHARLLALAGLVFFGLGACDDAKGIWNTLTRDETPAPKPPPQAAPRDPCITLLATNDLHGTLEPRNHGPDASPVREGGLPLLGAYVAAARATSKHAVLLIDAGDMYRGTFASDHFEGRPTIEAMNAMKYDAGVLGNHEFDFGSGQGGTNILGVVQQRVADAAFPILAVNVFDRATNHRIDWPNIKSSVLKKIGDVEVGIIGMSTVTTPSTTFARNVEPLDFREQQVLVMAESAILKTKGAQLIVLVGHVGTECKSIDDAQDASSCDKNSEMQQLLAALPKGTVDIAVAGHTHKDVANWIDGVPVIESSSYARKLGRIDVCVASQGGLDVANTTIRKPVPLCLTTWPDGSCGEPPALDSKVTPAVYEGVTIKPDPEVERVLAPYFDQVRAVKSQVVGVRLPAPLKRTSSPMPQLPVKKRRRLVPQPAKLENLGQYITRGFAEIAGTKLAFVNAGSIRNDLRAGDLVFSDIYDVCPFGNHVAVLKLKKSELAEAMRILAVNRKEPPPTFGFDVKLTGNDVALLVNGKPMRDGIYEVATSDFMALGGDGIGPALARLGAGDKRMLDPVDRDALMLALRARYPGPLPQKATPPHAGK